jgi:DNA-binding MarR family transcriptional regulator
MIWKLPHGEVTSQSEAAARALGALFEFAVLMTEAMERDLSERGLTRARATVIAYLHRGGPMRQRELAEALRVSPRNVTGLLDRLEATGFVARTMHPNDRRATLVTLTEHGTAVAKAMQTDEQHLARFLFADVPSDKVGEFADTLDHVIARLRDPRFARLRRSALKRWPSRRGA